MPTEAKRETVAELREELANARTMIVSEYRGLKVKEIAEIRRALRKQDVTYRVVKNRLLRIAADDSVGEALGPLLIGPTAIAFGNDEAGTAKAVLDATRPYTRSSGSPAASSATRRSARTTSPGLPRCRRARSCWPSWPVGCRPRSGTLAGLFAAPLRNLGYALQQVADQKAANPAHSAARSPTDPTPDHTDEGDIPWQS